MNRRHYPLGQDVALGALAGQVDQLRHDLTDLTHSTRGLRRDVAAHTRALDDLAQLARRGPVPTPDPRTPDAPDTDVVPDWMAVADPALAIAWLTDLSVWVPRVWVRYPGAPLPGCWPWHPPVVAELLVSRHVWAEATLPGQGAGALAAWHDRWRPGAMSRINRALSGCDRAAGCHVNTAGHHHTFDRAFLDELAHWWATSDRGNLDHAPGLTREHRHPDTPSPATRSDRGDRATAMGGRR